MWPAGSSVQNRLSGWSAAEPVTASAHLFIDPTEFSALRKHFAGGMHKCGILIQIFIASAVVSVIFSPTNFHMIRSISRIFACSLELSTGLTACCTCDIVPLVLSAAVPRICDVESSFFAFSEISRITDFMASLMSWFRGTDH